MRELPPPGHDPDEVRELVEELLARDEFEPPGRSVLERFLDWLNSLFDTGPATASPGSGGSGILTLLFLVGAVIALTFVARALLRRRRRPTNAAPAGPLVVFDVHRTAEEWAAAAAAAEQAGAWREGLRCRFASLVTRLVDRDVLPPTPGRTARELVDDLGTTVPAAAPDFAEAAALFERAWYGGESTGPEGARRFAHHASAVLEQATHHQATHHQATHHQATREQVIT